MALVSTILNAVRNEFNSLTKSKINDSKQVSAATTSTQSVTNSSSGCDVSNQNCNDKKSSIKDTVNQIINNNGKAPEGYKGGADFLNDGRNGGEILPQSDSSGNPRG